MRHRGLALFAACAALVSACREPTQIIVEITTDQECSENTNTGISVGTLVTLEGRQFATATSFCENKRIGSLVLVPRGADDEDVAFKVVMNVDGLPDQCEDSGFKTCIVARRSLRFLPNTRMRVPVEMSGACLQKPCSAGLTCVRGACVSAAVDPDACARPEGCDVSALSDGGVPVADAGADSGLDAGDGEASVPPLLPIQLSAGVAFTCARDSQKRGYCWGQNNVGQVGNGPADGGPVVSPERVATQEPLAEISAGETFACARTSGGKVLCWGDNAERKLGGGTDAGSSRVPVEVPGINDATHIEVGYFHACAARSSGTVSCWGRSSNGEIGETRGPPNGPTQFPLAPVSSLALGFRHSCARLEDGGVWCWGSRLNGETGPLDGGVIVDPMPVPQLGGATSHFGGGVAFSCALESGVGAVRCFGAQGSEKRLGVDLATGDYPNPVVAIASGATSLVVGPYRACAAVAGTVRCWGEAFSTAQTTQVERPELAPLTSLTLGFSHVCGVRPSGQIACAGGNENGQIGDGTTLFSTKLRDVVLP